MATFRAEADVKYKNPVTGQEVSYTSDQLSDPATGMLSDQFKPISTSAPTPSGNSMSPSVSGVPEGARKLGPREYEALRLENKVSPANFNQFFHRDTAGGIYLRSNAPRPLGQIPLTPTDTRTQDESIEDFTNRLGAEGAAARSTANKQIVGTSDAERNKIREKIRSEILPQGTMPTLPSLAEERIRLRKEQGIVNDEQDLSDLRNDARLAEQELRQFRTTAGQGVSEFGRAGAVSEAERNAMFRLEGLAIRERALVERVNSKNAFIDQAIKDRQFDYAAATDKWNQEFAINSKVNDLLNTEMDDIQKDALATVTTISNLMEESGVAYDQWPSEMKMQVETAALQAGLPKDTFKVAYGSQQGGDKVLSHIVQENAQGGKDVYVLTQNKQGGVGLKKVGGTESAGGISTDAPVTREIGGTTFQWNESSRSWDVPSVSTTSDRNMVSGPDIAKLPEAKQLAGIGELQRTIGNYKSLIEQYGAASGFTPGARQQLDSAKEAINLAIKNAEALGALQAPDIELVQRMIPDVTREGVLDSLLGLVVPGEAKRALKTIGNAADLYKEKSNNLYQQIVSLGANPNDPYLKTLAQQAGITKTDNPEDASGESLFLDGVEYIDDGNGNFAPKANSAPTSMLRVRLPSGQTKEGGSASWRNNNPLNIKAGSFAKPYGALQGSPATDGGHFAAFPSVEVGLKAARDLLRSKNYASLSLDAAMRRWSNNGYGDEVAPMDIRKKKISQMKDSEIDQLIEAMTRREGWKEGKILV